MNFDSTGIYISSFSTGDSLIKIWKIGTTGFFGSILGMQGKSLKVISVPKKSYLNENLKGEIRISIKWIENDKCVALKIGNLNVQKYDVFK